MEEVTDLFAHWQEEPTLIDVARAWVGWEPPVEGDPTPREVSQEEWDRMVAAVKEDVRRLGGGR